MRAKDVLFIDDTAITMFPTILTFHFIYFTSIVLELILTSYNILE